MLIRTFFRSIYIAKQSFILMNYHCHAPTGRRLMVHICHRWTKARGDLRVRIICHRLKNFSYHPKLYRITPHCNIPNIMHSELDTLKMHSITRFGSNVIVLSRFYCIYNVQFTRSVPKLVILFGCLKHSTHDLTKIRI